MNKVLLTGRLTRDPEMRSLASGKNVTTVRVAVCAIPARRSGCAGRFPWIARLTGVATASVVRRPNTRGWTGPGQVVGTSG